MEVVQDLETERWFIEEWDRSLDWDAANTDKLMKHSVTVKQVESLFDRQFLFGGKIIPPGSTEWGENRFILHGQTEDGRRLSIVWTIRDKKICPISCRSMRNDESKIFESKDRSGS